MTARAVIATIALLPALAPGQAADVEHGKSLHQRSCLSCHDTGVYTRPDRRIKSLSALDAQVRQCDANLGTQLSGQDITDIVSYLNQSFYRFEGAASP
jgi:mono/diheme cytochrome c family protein